MDGQSREPVRPTTVSAASSSVPDRQGPRPVKTVAGWLYTSNPFYAISAALIFAGLRISFGADGQTSFPWGLAGGLFSYALLLAASSYLLVRYGKVWDDARSLLLLLVLVLVALSLSFDDVLTGNFRQGAALNLAGLAFATAVSELLLRGLRIRLPAAFRLPYYLLLAIFFIYPVVIAGQHFAPGADRLHWAFLGFPVSASLALVALLPAARRGEESLRENGTPWNWPWFPWPLFAVLGLCACGRTYSICVSLDFIGGSASAFGLYFLAPLCLAAALLFLEVGLRTPGRSTVAVGMVLAAAAPLLGAIDRPDPVYRYFVQVFHETVGGTPLFITISLAGVFYLAAAARGVRPAMDCLTLCVAMLSLVHPDTVALNTSIRPAAWPLAVAAAIQLAAAIARSSSARATLAGLLAVCAVSLPFGLTKPVAIVAPAHLLLLVGLLVALVFDDRFARLLRRAGSVAIVFLALLAIADPGWPLRDAGAGVSWWYPLIWLAVAIGYGWRFNSCAYYHAAAVISLSWLGAHGMHVYQQLRTRVAGLDHLAAGLVFFACALLVSLNKAGITIRSVAARIPKLPRIRE